MIMIPGGVFFLLVAVVITVCGQDSEHTCLEDGSHCTCRDEHARCEYWKSLGECESNAAYMRSSCPMSCGVCDPNELDLGLPQQNGQLVSLADFDATMARAKAYVEKVATDPLLKKTLQICKNKNETCAFWGAIGECQKNPSYMEKQCAPICESCHLLTVETRCPLDPNATNALKPGGLDELFLNITTLPENQKYLPKVLSRPNLLEADSEGTIDYKLGPWIVFLENFLSDEECTRLIDLGFTAGYKRSADVGKMKPDGTYEQSVNSGRTSFNAWCQDECYDDSIAKDVIFRVGNVTGIPDENQEYLQILQYEVGQYYQTHHDYIDYQLSRQTGVRLLTVFLYLNDVEAGGGTNFPYLNLTVMPKKGTALIWPSVLNENPDLKDDRTSHQALAVEAGIKYGANAWLHQRDFKQPNRMGCQ